MRVIIIYGCICITKGILMNLTVVAAYIHHFNDDWSNFF